MRAMVKARVMGPWEVARTVHSKKPWELGGGKGTNRQISMREFEECKWLPKNVKLSASVATRRLERAPIFCERRLRRTKMHFLLKILLLNPCENKKIPRISATSLFTLGAKKLRTDVSLQPTTLAPTYITEHPKCGFLITHVTLKPCSKGVLLFFL